MSKKLTDVSRRKFMAGTAAVGAMTLTPAALLAEGNPSSAIMTAALQTTSAVGAPNIVVTLTDLGGRSVTARAGEGKPWPAPFNNQRRWDVVKAIGPEKMWISFGQDADGRMDVWFYLAFSTTSNSVVVPLKLSITVGGTPVNLWGQGTTVTVNAVRSGLWRWQSRPRKWQFDRIPGLVSRNMLLRHESATFSTATYQSRPYFTSLGPGVPFTNVSGTTGGTMVSDFMRASATGGERETIGLIHEKHARIIEEVLKGNLALATRSEPSLVLAQELIGQYPGYFFFHVDTGRVLDPSDTGQLGKCCWHRNALAAQGARYIPQAGTNASAFGDGTASWDIAHPQNHHCLPYLLTDDPYYLLMTQMNATAAIGYGTARFRPAGYKGVLVEEERGLWWGLRQLFWAEMLTPATGVPPIFLPRSYFTQGIDQTFNYINGIPAGTTLEDQIQRFWGASQTIRTESKYIGYSPFQNDYGHEVLLWMYLAGRPIPPALMTWKLQNLFNRIRLWGDYVNAYIGIVPGINSIVAPQVGTALPYRDLEGYHAWVTKQRVAAGLPALSRTAIRISFGGALHRDWHIVHGLLNLLKAARAKGLAVPFDPNERIAALMRDTIDARTGTRVVFPIGTTFFAKQGFKY